jgi:DHA1 family tetracycline resistance protein-like MFS transporter
MMSQLVTPSEQGQLQGANASIMAVAGLFGPGLFSFTFAWSIARGPAAGWPGLAFLLAAALLVLAAALAWQVTRRVEASEPGAN